MDGSPSRGETIPIRLFLGGFDLTPTFREVNKKYSTRYYLSLVLIDEGKHSTPQVSRVILTLLDARRYFKQSEIVLYRQQPEIAAAAGQQTQIAGVPAERAQAA
jgi:vacuolar protein sorting-associated protein 26